jgi:type IV pilus assembly protein PilO
MNENIILLIFNARKKCFIAIFILILANIGLYIFYSAHLEPGLNALQTKWSEKRLLDASGNPVDTASVYRHGTADLSAFYERIPRKKEFVAFIGDLFETAANNSLKVGEISYKPAIIKGEKLIAYSIGFDVAGKYAAIKSFISDIEGLRQIAVIDDISLSGKADEEYVEMKVRMTAYFRGEGQ